MQRSPGSQTVAPSPLATRTRSESGDRRLIVMTRIPEAGRVKTRLIPVLGAAGAAALHARLLERTLATGGAHSETSPVTVELRYAGDTETPFRSRMTRAFRFVVRNRGRDWANGSKRRSPVR